MRLKNFLLTIIIVNEEIFNLPGFYVPEWVKKSRRIVISREQCIKEKCSESVMKGIKEFINKIGLEEKEFNIRDVGESKKITGLVEKSTRKEEKRSYINFHKLGRKLQTYERSRTRGSPRAHFVLCDKLGHSDDYKWAKADYELGFVLLKLSGMRQDDLDYIQKASEHGTSHLLGYKEIESSLEPESKERVHSELDDKSCLVLTPQSDLCDRCTYNFKIYWKQIGDKIGQQLLMKDVLEEIGYSNQI